MLDMEPYTVEGMARREGEQAERSSVSSEGDVGDVSEVNMAEGNSEAAAMESDRSPIHYHLVGIVVHSGQANAGHYYSYIRDRR